MVTTTPWARNACSSLASIAIARHLRSFLDAPLTKHLELLQSTKDIRKAFRQVPVHDTRLRCTVKVLRSSEAGCQVYSQLLGMPFGLLGAVFDFNLVGGALEALARRYLGVSVLGCHADFKVSECRPSAPSAAHSFRDRCWWLGLCLTQTRDKICRLVCKYLETWRSLRLVAIPISSGAYQRASNCPRVTSKWMSLSFDFTNHGATLLREPIESQNFQFPFQPLAPGRIVRHVFVPILTRFCGTRESAQINSDKNAHRKNPGVDHAPKTHQQHKQHGNGNTQPHH